MLTAIVGINWGDEGKGRMVDLISRDYDVVCGHAAFVGENGAGLLRYLYAVVVTGVGVAGIDYYRARVTVFQVFFRDDEGRAFYGISRIYRRGGHRFFRHYERKIEFRFVFSEARVYSGSGKAFGKSNAVVVCCDYHILSPVLSFIPSIMFMFCKHAPEAPLPRLSNTAVTVSLSPLPFTEIIMSSLPESIPAEANPFS